MKAKETKFVNDLNIILEYMYEDEAKHYEETYNIDIDKEMPTEKHVFTYIRRIMDFLQYKME